MRSCDASPRIKILFLPSNSLVVGRYDDNRLLDDDDSDLSTRTASPAQRRRTVTRSEQEAPTGSSRSEKEAPVGTSRSERECDEHVIKLKVVSHTDEEVTGAQEITSYSVSPHNSGSSNVAPTPSGISLVATASPLPLVFMNAKTLPSWKSQLVCFMSSFVCGDCSCWSLSTVFFFFPRRPVLVIFNCDSHAH